jgi:hypothetical protein
MLNLPILGNEALKVSTSRDPQNAIYRINSPLPVVH